MAEEKDRGNNVIQEVIAEITSEEKYSIDDDDDLELTLGLRPINYPRPLSTTITFQKLPQLSDHHHQRAAISTETLPKRDAQALRRFEARKKRHLKSKSNHHQTASLLVEERDNEEDGEGEGGRCCKTVRLNASYCAQPSWWSWNSSAAAAAVYGGGFRSYQGKNGKIAGAGKNVEGRDGENRQSISTGSSSGISDKYQSISGTGGNNSSADAGSHSGQSHPQLLPEPIVTLQTQPSSSSCNQTIKHVTSSTHSASKSKSPEGVTSSSTTVPEGGPTSNKGPTSAVTKGEKTGKPPKPNGQASQQKLMVSQMPCVSATGTGPNGKTITGFLYRYSKAEVSIVCVCHGASFSPAGFVEHAGGVNIEHPLRHIRVAPFALS